MDLNVAYRQGLKARREGIPLKGNPYLVEPSPDHGEWQRGWQAMDEMMRIAGVS